MPQVVTSENMVQLIQTGSVDDFKPPEAPKPAAAPKPAEAPPPTAVRDPATGKFTKAPEGDKTTPAAAPSSPDDAGEKDLPEVVRRKIDTKHRQMKEAEEFARSEFRRAQAAEERAARLQQQLDAQNPKSRHEPDQAPTEPKPDDFKTVAEYTDALVSFRVDQRLREEKAKSEREATEREKQARAQEFGKRVAEARTKHADFDDVLQSISGTDLDRVHQDVTEYMQESEHGAELLYHLAKNPDVLDRLRKQSPRKFIAELGKLEAKWESPPSDPAPSETPTKLTEVATNTGAPVSRAPAPIAPIESSGIAPVAKKPDDMSVQELREYRRQQDMQRRAAGR